MLLQFYHCPICGNIVVKIVDSGVTPVCCGQEMKPLVPKTEEEYMEKHLPVLEKCEHHVYKVKVGEVEHPMTDQHYIMFICLQTEDGFVLSYLDPGDEPEVTFCCRSKPLAVYSYCNVHGLWRVESKDNCKNRLFKKCKQ